MDKTYRRAEQGCPESLAQSGMVEGRNIVQLGGSARKLPVHVVVFLCLIFCASLFAQAPQQPTFQPGSVIDSIAFPVKITCDTPGASIYFTLDGTDPNPPLTGVAITSGSSVQVRHTLTLKAIAQANGYSSAITAERYEVTGAIAMGENHAIALKSDGALWSWGQQGSGRLGNGQAATAAITVPQQVLKLSGTSSVPVTDAVDAAAGNDHSLFVDSAGYVYSFGNNDDGELGNNTTVASSSAVRVLKSTGATDYLGGIVLVSAGAHFSLALSGSTGEVWAWGVGDDGRLGNSQTSGRFKYAAKVISNPTGTSLNGIDQICTGRKYALAKDSSGSLWSWGHNEHGQLGLGHTDSKAKANAVKISASGGALTDVVDIATGGWHSVALCQSATEDGTVWCWGRQENGRLGNGATSAASIKYPVRVQKVGGTPLTNIVQVAAGVECTLALDDVGNVWTWGKNNAGQLGDGTTTDRSRAAVVSFPTGSTIVRIGAGGESCFAIDIDGTIYTWGANANGQLGLNGSTSNKTSPQVAGGTLRVSAVPTASLNVAPGSGPLIAPASLALSTTTSNFYAPISGIDFFSGNILLGSALATPHIFYFDNIPAGTYSLSARVRDTSGDAVTTSAQEVTIISPAVSLTAPVPGACVIGDEGFKKGALRFSRNYTGETPGGAIEVFFTVTGSAIPNSDYTALPASVTIPAGAPYVDVPITPLPATFQGDDKTVIVTLDSRSHYAGGASTQATVSIIRDDDEDGLSNQQEGLNGTDPNDYYNGDHPQVVIVSGNNQGAKSGEFLLKPLMVEVCNSFGVPLNNAPVFFSVTLGKGLLFTTTTGSGASTMNLRTGSDGRANLFFRLPTLSEKINKISAGVYSVTGGHKLVEFTAYESKYTIPRDGLKVWLQADAGVTLSGSAVVTWADQSGNNNDAVKFAGAADDTRPALNFVNGKAGVVFDGTNDRLTLPSQIGSNSFTVIAVVASTATRTQTTPGTMYPLRDDGKTGQRYLFSGPISSASSPWSVPAKPAAKRYSRWTYKPTNYVKLNGNEALFPVPSQYGSINFRYDITDVPQAPYRDWDIDSCEEDFIANNSSHYGLWKTKRESLGRYDNMSGANVIWTEGYYEQRAEEWQGQPQSGAIQNVAASVSAGQNGISIFEHHDSYYPSVAVRQRSPVDSGLRVVSVTYQNGKPSIRDNGGNVVTGLQSLSTTVRGPQYIGSSSLSGNYFAGRILEVLIYDRDLSDEECVSVENYISGRNGLSSDSDSDGLPDWWELRYFAGNGQTASGDPDGDGLTNAQEYAAGTDPTSADTDQDGLVDGIEVNITLTNPLVRDSDGDGFPDGYEVVHGMNPLDSADGFVDADSNGIPDGWEFASNYDPKTTDTDGDGIVDSLEILIGTNPYTSGDSTGTGLGDPLIWALGLKGNNQDFDGDTLTNAQELALGTNPFLADSDGDGVNDKNDYYPLDPTRWQAPVSNPNDHTAPTISLTAPSGAVLQ